jgi:hypothetical protein
MAHGWKGTIIGNDRCAGFASVLCHGRMSKEGRVMKDDTGNRLPPGKPANSDGEQTLSGREILIVLALVALAVAGGYFFLMKMIDVSQQEDCVLAQRRNCTPSEPFRR